MTKEETYRLVMVDTEGKEAAVAVTLTVSPHDVLVVMPQSADQYFAVKQMETIAEAFARHDIKGIVLPFPVAFARLERVES